MNTPTPADRAPVRVVLVDDHAMFRAGVRAELAASGAGVVEVVGEAADADAAVAVIHELQPQVVLLDVHLPGGGGVEVMRRQPAPDACYLALSVSDAAEDVIGTIRGGARGYVTKTITGPELVDAITRVAGGDAVFSPRLAGFVLDAFAGSIDVAAVDEDLDRLTEREREVMRRMPHADARYLALSVSDAAEDVIGTIRGGARGYVTKSITGPELVAAVERVAGGDAVFSPRLAGFVLDAFAGSIDVAAVDEDLDRLTEREREVMRLIARGYAYKEVASELFISVKTVETHVSSVLRKLQLSSRHELTRWASERRLL